MNLGYGLYNMIIAKTVGPPYSVFSWTSWLTPVLVLGLVFIFFITWYFVYYCHLCKIKKFAKKRALDAKLLKIIHDTDGVVEPRGVV